MINILSLNFFVNPYQIVCDSFILLWYYLLLLFLLLFLNNITFEYCYVEICFYFCLYNRVCVFTSRPFIISKIIIKVLFIFQKSSIRMVYITASTHRKAYKINSTIFIRFYKDYFFVIHFVLYYWALVLFHLIFHFCLSKSLVCS